MHQGPDGHLKKTNRYRLSLTCNGLDLRAFPFDTQILPIRLKAQQLFEPPLSQAGLNGPRYEARNKSNLHSENESSEVILVGPEGQANGQPLGLADGL